MHGDVKVLTKENSDGRISRPWHLRAWAGMDLSAWLRPLWRNRFAVSPTRVPMALVITILSLCNSALGLLQSCVYGRRIRRSVVEHDPIFVLGHWRSGTTLLHELLVCDPRHAYPDTLACFAPHHFLLTGRLLKNWLTVFVPPQRPMDNIPIRWESPQEDEWALCNLGQPSPYLTILFPNREPQDPEYLDLRGVPQADLDRWKLALTWFLQALTFRDPKRLVLKTPLHTARVRILLEMYPRARFVHVVRDPVAVFSSTMYTWRQLYNYEALQVARYEGLEEYVFETLIRMYDAFEADRQLVPPDQLCEVHYEDLVRDPVSEIRRIYEQLGLDGFEQALPAIQTYLSNRANYSTNRFQLDPTMREKIRRRWAQYAQRYGYQSQLEKP
jgi:hypothetical protein